MPTINPEYLNTVQAAEYLGLSRQLLELWRHRSEGPSYVKLGRAVRYRRTALDEFMASRERRHGAEAASS